MQANSWHHELLDNYWIYYEGKKEQIFKYLENEKSFLDEIKRIFHKFWKVRNWWKINKTATLIV